DLKYSDDVGSYDFLQLNECKEASEVTLSCKDQNRGFHGETEEWMKAWISDKDENLSNKAVLVHKEDKKIAGILCAATYPASNKNGLIVWVREVAVRPEYQRKGIARKLIKQAINYGIEHGAVKSFLAADENNIHAIKLYKSLGYNGKYNEAEINMIKE
ncbi:MAG: hypothetical protein K0S55_2049, partial [Clostridia bacterium]|nr:hypothetical protein [Clostridia bacterium]